MRIGKINAEQIRGDDKAVEHIVQKIQSNQTNLRDNTSLLQFNVVASLQCSNFISRSLIK